VKRLLGLGKIVVALFAINFAAIAVVALVMMSKGMVTRDRVAAAVDALRGPPEALEAGQTTQPVGLEIPPPPMSLTDRTRAMALVQAERDRDSEDLRQLALMVERERERLEQDRAAFEAEREEFTTSMDVIAQARKKAGLRQVLKTFEALKAPRIKALVEDRSDTDVAEILVGLEPRLRGKVIDEFKDPDELIRIRKVIDLIREGVGSKVSAQTAGLPTGSR